MRIISGVYDTNPETASEFPHGPVIDMGDGRQIFFDLFMEKEAEICFAALQAWIDALPRQEYAHEQK
jgi:hypothetical protein